MFNIQHALKEKNLGKRKTGALRNNSYNTHSDYKNFDKTFYMNQAKTINFSEFKPAKVRKPIDLIPKTLGQEKYILQLLNENTDIVVASGPAGTGKTYLAMLAAIKALRSGDVNQLVLTRPAVTVDDEKHGFLPGDLNQKMEPWTKPLIDVLREYYTVKEIKTMLDEQTIEIAPLAFCRGRNFKYSYIICDEAQNATPSQLKMIMTRIGVGSKIIITGDIEQTDRKTRDNGLADLLLRLNSQSIDGVATCEFTIKDIQRHRIIEHVLKLYSE